MADSIRLAKRVAELRACSRREAEQIIIGGWVRVDGLAVEEPQFRVTDQQIDIDPGASLEQTEPVTLLLHKPIRYHTGLGDSEHAAPQLLKPETLWIEDMPGRVAAKVRPLKMHFTHLTACAPLETSASGLVVFSQDWRIVRKLIEDAATVEHEMVVEVTGDLAANQTPEGLNRLSRGVVVKGVAASSLKISWQNETRLRVALKGAQIGQIQKLCEAAGLQVLSMKRIRLGGVSMGKLPPGQWRYLRESERF